MKVNGRIQLYPVLRLVVFLVAGIIAGKELYGIISEWSWYIALIVSFVSSICLKKNAVVQTVAIFVTFVFLGGCLTSMELSKINVELPKDEITFEAVVISSPVVSGKVVRCDMLVSSMERPMKVKASFTEMPWPRVLLQAPAL